MARKIPPRIKTSDQKQCGVRASVQTQSQKSTRSPNRRRQKPLAPDRRLGHLIPIDASDRRQLERRQYHKMAKEVQKLSEQLKDHGEKDLNSFTMWLHASFRTDLEKVEKMREKAFETQRFLAALERFRSTKKVSKFEAYQTLVVVRENGTLTEFMERECPEPKRRPSRDDDDLNGFEDIEDILRDFFETIAGESFPGDHGDDVGHDGDRGHSRGWGDFGFGDRGHHGGVKRQNVASGREQEDIHLKSLYRQLVRTLHPDMGASFSSESQAMWNEVQDAYRWGDLDRLNKLHEQVFKKGGLASHRGDIAGGLNFAGIPIGDIIALRLKLQQRLQGLRRRVSVAKKDPHWQFRKIREKGGLKFERLLKQVYQEIRDEFELIEEHQKLVESHVAQWARSTRSAQKRVPKTGRRPRVTSSRSSAWG